MSERKKAAPTRCFLYSLEFPTGKIFTGDEAIEDAIKADWKKTPPSAELLAQAAEEAQADETGSALLELSEANQALVKELETAQSALQAANQRADDAEAKLVKASDSLIAAELKLKVATTDKGGKGAGQ